MVLFQPVVLMPKSVGGVGVPRLTGCAVLSPVVWTVEVMTAIQYTVPIVRVTLMLTRLLIVFPHSNGLIVMSVLGGATTRMIVLVLYETALMTTVGFTLEK